MSEKFSFAENNSEITALPEDTVAGFLNIEGPEAPGFLDWIKQERKRLMKENPEEAEARLGAELARVYYKAGYYGGGLERMNSIRVAASRIGGDFYKEVEDTIGKMERGENL